MHLNSAEYGIQTSFNPPQAVRVLAPDIQDSYDKACYHLSLQVMILVYRHIHTSNLFLIWI